MLSRLAWFRFELVWLVAPGHGLPCTSGRSHDLRFALIYILLTLVMLRDLILPQCEEGDWECGRAKNDVADELCRHFDGLWIGCLRCVGDDTAYTGVSTEVTENTIGL